ncbi:MAG: cation:proton antiporter family protein [Balneolaceae bacterium]
MDLLWVGVAFIGGLLVQRIGVPALVGYLLAGIVLGLYGYEAGPMLQEIAHVGVLLLLFTVGLHIRIKNILQWQVFGVALTHLGISFGGYYLLTRAFGVEGEGAVLLAILLGFSSTVLAAKTLEMRGVIGSYYGRVAIGVLVIQDLVAIGVIAWSGGEAPSGYALLLLGIPLLRPLVGWVLSRIEARELVLLLGLVMALGGAELFELARLSGELGALLVGMLLATHERGEELDKSLWGLKEMFLVGFFLEIGLIGLPSGLGVVVIVTLLLLQPLKGIFYFLLFTRFGLKARTSYLAAITLTSYSEFMLIAGSVATENGLLSENALVTMGLVVAISFVVNAIISNLEDPIWQRYDERLHRFERRIKHPDREVLSLGSAHYLVIGMGNAGRAAYDYLREKDRRVVGMDLDPDRIEYNLNSGRRVVYGDIQDTDLWEGVDLSDIEAVIIAMGNHGSKIKAVKALREIGYDRPIYVITMRDSESKELEAVGASSVSIPVKQAGRQLAQLSISDHKIGEPMDVEWDVVRSERDVTDPS